MKKIITFFVLTLLLVSGIFAVPRKPFEEWTDSEKESLYDKQLRAFGLYDIDGIDFDVKVELVNRLRKRSLEEQEYYKELMANPPEGYEFTEYDKKMMNDIKKRELDKKILLELAAERRKTKTEFQEKSKQSN